MSFYGNILNRTEAILETAEMVKENDKGATGRFIKLTFRTEEEARSTVYIDVTELNEDQDIDELKYRTDAVEADLALIKQDLAQYATVSNGVLKFTKGQGW